MRPEMKTIPIYDWTLAWTKSKGLRVWAQDEVDSTNRVAKDDANAATRPLLANPPALVERPSVYLARAQTQGRGRSGNAWISADGALLSSWAFALSHVPQPVLAPQVGLALYEAARAAWPEMPFNLKAPNDLYVGRKKVAGLLIETVEMFSNGAPEKRTVIGLGLNVGSHPTEIETATSLAANTESTLDETGWASFLELWSTKLQAALVMGLKDKMSPDTCIRLKDALNQHPLLEEPILEVDAQGQLRSASRTLLWHQL